VISNRLPGFTSEATLYGSGTQYWTQTTSAQGQGEQRVTPQLRGGIGGISSGGLSFHWPTWCELACASAAAACIAGTVGAGVSLCVLAEIACLNACNSSVQMM
jgi:hypothetical protein